MHINVYAWPARADDRRFIATVNYGHFTSMQVRCQSVRGLNLHLDRLERSTRELFGCGLDRERVRSWIRGALRDREEPASVRVNVYSRSLKSELLDAQAEPDPLLIDGAIGTRRRFATVRRARPLQPLAKPRQRIRRPAFAHLGKRNRHHPIPAAPAGTARTIVAGRSPVNPLK